MKIYRTFEEIDHDLKVLKLQTEIDKEQVKLGISRIKEDFSPFQLAGSMVGSITKKIIMLKGIADIFRMRKRR